MSKKAYNLLTVLFGAIAGLLTGVIVMFLWMHTEMLSPMLYMVVLDQMKVYEVVAKAYGIHQEVLIHICHFFTSAILGVLFALIFHRQVKTLWRGLWIGSIFGVIWWLLTPFYIMPLFFSIPEGFRWSDATTWAVMNALIGHIVFGLLIGFFYAVLRKLIKNDKKQS